MNLEIDELKMIFEDILHKCNYVYPDNIAIINEDIDITYKDFANIVFNLESQLKSVGLMSYDRVALRFENPLNHLIFYFILIKNGITLVSLNISDTKESQEKDLLVIEATCIIQDINPDEDSLSDRTIYVKETFKLHNKKISSIKINKKEFWGKYAFALYGSGTTGKKKIIGITKLALADQILRDASICDFNIGERYYTATNLYFNTPKRRLLAALYNGLTILLPNHQPKDIVSFCIKNSINHLALTTTQAIYLLPKDNVDKEKLLLPKVKSLIVSSSVVHPHIRNHIINSITKNLYIGYGSNECGELTIAKPEDIDKYENIVGKALNNVDIKILDDNRNKCDIGVTGNIVINYKNMINGYIDNHEDSKKSFKEEGFFIGDLGELTPDGYLIVKGRKDDLMIFSGVNIYPIEIESVLASHPNVIESAVFPLNIGYHTDVPFAVVVCDKFVQENELLQWCKKYLDWKVPFRIFNINEIPRNQSGKIIKKELIKLVSTILKRKQEKSVQNTNIKQPTKEYKIEITIPKDISIELINIWFKDVLNLKEITISSNNHFLEEVCNKTLVLIQTLFEISQIPIFYHGKIKHINLNNNKYNVILDIGYIDLIPNEFYIKVINFSFKYILWMGQFEPNIENKHYFYKICQEEIINPIQKNMPPGKSRIPVLKTAFNKNIPFIHLGNGVYQLGWGNKSRKMDRSTIDTDSAMGSNLSQNKIFTANLLKMAALPAPIHGVAQTKEEALEIALQLKYPVVIKPIDLDRGEGVTVDIYDENRLFKAFELAFNLSKSKRVIVEKQVLGVCHRLFIANNKLLYCVKRLAISVQADGINNISTLIDNANNLESNKAPWIKKEFYPKDALTIEALKKVGFTLDSIPLKNTWIELRDIESTQWGGRDEDVTTIVHPDNLDIALRASKLFGLSVAGIDIITNDISKSWSESNAIINEVNFAPLLGGGEISRSCIPKFFDDFIEKDGRIPLEIFIGNTQETINIAKAKQEEYLNAGYKCYLTTHNTTLDNNLKQIILPTNNISNRTQALLLNNNVEALILLIQNNEFLYTPIPFDKASKITIISKELKNIHSNKNIDKIEFDNLIYNISM